MEFSIFLEKFLLHHICRYEKKRPFSYMVYLTKRAGKYKILSRVIKILPRAAKPQGEVFFHKGEYFITYPTAWGGIVFLYSPDRGRIWSISRKKRSFLWFDGKLTTRESIAHLKSILSPVVYITRESIEHLKSILSRVVYSTREKYQNTFSGGSLRDYIRMVFLNLSAKNSWKRRKFLSL